MDEIDASTALHDRKPRASTSSASMAANSSTPPSEYLSVAWRQPILVWMSPVATWRQRIQRADYASSPPSRARRSLRDREAGISSTGWPLASHAALWGTVGTPIRTRWARRYRRSCRCCCRDADFCGHAIGRRDRALRRDWQNDGEPGVSQNAKIDSRLTSPTPPRVSVWPRCCERQAWTPRTRWGCQRTPFLVSRWSRWGCEAACVSASAPR